MTTAKSPSMENAEKIEVSLNKLGAATIRDVAGDVRLSPETVRRYINELFAAGRVVEILPAGPHTQAVYGPIECSDEQEFDVRRSITASWPRGQHRPDPIARWVGFLVAAA